MELWAAASLYADKDDAFLDQYRDNAIVVLKDIYKKHSYIKEYPNNELYAATMALVKAEGNREAEFWRGIR